MNGRDAKHFVQKLCLLAGLSLTVPAFGQSVVYDGSMGPAGSLSGDMIISDDFGTQVGANLFHSFSIFNVLTGESATFTSNFAGATDNVIARVTGGGNSMIDGALVNDIAGANLWLINPAGIVFGDNAIVDMQGSFHASTADYLLLADGGVFSSSLDGAKGTVLTMGNPTSFGFLGPNVAPISVGAASFMVSEASTITLTGGDIDLQNSHFRAPGGQVGLVAVEGAGEILLSNAGFGLSGFDGMASISLEGTLLDVSSDGGGDVYIHGGRFVMSRGSEIRSRSSDQDGGEINISVDSVELSGASTIATGTNGSGRAADISLIATGGATLTGGSQLTSVTTGPGNSGNIMLSAGGLFSASGWDAGSGRVSGLNTGSTRFGNVGDIEVNAGSIVLGSGGQINSASSFFGNSGNIKLAASGHILMSGLSGNGASSGLDSSNLSRGNAGDVDITADSLTINDGAFIWAGSRAAGDAGQVSIQTAGDVTIASSANRVSGISVQSGGRGNGGVIDIAAQNFFLSGGSEIILRAENSRGGAPGRFSLSARDSIMIDQSKIFAEGYGDGTSASDIAFNAQTIYLDGALVTIDLGYGDGSAGSISLNGDDSIVITGYSNIGSASYDATQPGADIFINTDNLEISDGSYIFTNTYFESAGAGNIYINANELTITDASIDAGSCFCSSGDAGGIFINVSGNIYLSGSPESDDPSPRGIRSQTLGSGNGGIVEINAGGIYISDGAAIITSSTSTAQDFVDTGQAGVLPGRAGAIFITAEYLEMVSGGSIQSAAIEAAGGNISLDIGRFIYMTDAEISAAAQGVTPQDDGGNVTIAGPTAIVLHHSAIRANANAGNGGNISITAEVLVPSVDSVLDASSQTGVDGQIVIDSPNQAVSSVALLDTPVLDVSALVQDPCEVKVLDQRSSLTIEGQGGLPAAPDDYQPSPAPARDSKTSWIPYRNEARLVQEIAPGACEEAGP